MGSLRLRGIMCWREAAITIAWMATRSFLWNHSWAIFESTPIQCGQQYIKRKENNHRHWAIENTNVNDVRKRLLRRKKHETIFGIISIWYFRHFYAIAMYDLLGWPIADSNNHSSEMDIQYALGLFHEERWDWTLFGAIFLGAIILDTFDSGGKTWMVKLIRVLSMVLIGV